MEIYPIISEADYHRALSQFEKFFDAPSGSKESREAELLALIVDLNRKTWLELLEAKAVYRKYLTERKN